MAKINVQFHAEPTETISFIKDCAQEYKLNIVLIKLQPMFSVKLIDSTVDKIWDVPTCDTNRICLCTNKPDTSAKSLLDFVDRNLDCLLITIGRYHENKLEESVLATKTENAESLKVWKMVVKKLNAITLAGAWVVNPNNGAKAFYKQHRYTDKAKKLFENGIKILPVTGWNYYTLGE